MKYRKPDYYDTFVCIADRCPATCCQGWQIAIDDETLKAYWNLQGSFANRLKNSVDWEYGVFCQYQGKCELLNERNLCDLYENLGEAYLCDACREYPRHVEEFENVREYSLSLSCPEAARILLTQEGRAQFIEWETEEEEQFEEGFDSQLYGVLLQARQIMCDILMSHRQPFAVSMELVQMLAENLQGLLDEGQLALADTVLGRFQPMEEQEQKEAARRARIRRSRRWDTCGEELKLLRTLPHTDPTWMEILDWMENERERLGRDGWEALHGALESGRGCGNGMPADRMQWEEKAARLAVSFLYTYFCGAVYDGQMAAACRFAVFCADWILELAAAQWQRQGRKERPDVVTAAWRFSREMEHRDENREALQEYLEKRGRKV